MKPKEWMVAVLNGGVPNQVFTGELGVDYPITEYVLGHRTYHRAKYREKSALRAGKRDEVVASQKRDLVDLAQAREDGMPAFVIFHDRVLHAIAASLPTDPDALMAIPGIGPAKLDRYGHPVLAIVQAYLVDTTRPASSSSPSSESAGLH